MKKVLIIYYSQTGQLKDIISNFVAPFSETHQVDFLEIKTDRYKFPLTFNSFFDAFPESVLSKTCEITHQTTNYGDYETVILGFQPWFLHLSVPFNSFVESNCFADAIRHKSVILITDCRSTWRNSIRHLTEKVCQHGGVIKGVYVFRDVSAGNVMGALTLLKWFKDGHKTKLFNHYPLPGVDEEIIKNSKTFGQEALEIISNTKVEKGSPCYSVIPERKKEFTSKGYEEFAINKFKKWANYITENNNRHRSWRLFKFKIWIIVTIVFIAPFVSKKRK